MARIVITRPYAQGQKFAQYLLDEIDCVKDDQIILEPLLKIKQKDVRLDNSVHYDGVIITSVNAIHAIKQNPDLLNVAFYCVGQKTAEELKTIGAVNIVQCCQTVAPLIDELKLVSDGQKFLYLRGHDVSVDIKSALQLSDVMVDDVVCYSADAIDHFSELFLSDLRNQNIGLVTLFSKRTAEVFVRLILQEQKENSVDVDQIDILCISQPVLEYVSSVLKTGNIMVSDKSDMKAMAESVRQYCS